MAATSIRRPRRDPAEYHRLIVGAARQLLGESGPDASMEQIAARAGVGVGSVYRLFPNKDSLVRELVKLVTDELIGAGEEVLARDDGHGLEAYLRLVGESFAEHRRWACLLLGHAQTDDGATVVRSQLASLFDNAREAGTVGPDIRLGDVMALMWGLRGLVESTGDVAPDAWRRHLDIHLVGLRSAGDPSAAPALTASQLQRLAAVTRSARHNLGG